MCTKGNSTLIDLLIFYTLTSMGITLLASTNVIDVRDRRAYDLAHSILNSVLFSTTGDEIGYQIQGYDKRISGKSWAEAVTESAFLYVHEPEVGKKLVENLRIALDRKIKSFSSRGFIIALDMTSTELGFSVHAGENVKEPAAVASALLFSSFDTKICLKVEVRVCRG